MNTNRVIAGPLIAVAMGAGAVVAFLIPAGTVFGVLLVLLCGAYSLCLATGMNAHAGLGDTATHLTGVVSRFRGALQATRTPAGTANDGGQPTPPPWPQPTPPVATPPPSPQSPETASDPATTPAASITPPAPMTPSPPPAEEPPTQSPPTPPVSLVKTAPAVDPASGQAGAPPPPTDPLLPPVTTSTSPPQQLSPGPRSTRSRMPLIAAALTVVLILVVGAGAFVGWRAWQSRDGGADRASTAFPSGMVHRAFPTVPSPAFAVVPEQLGAEVFTRPNYLVGGEESTGFLRSDRYLITGMGNGALVAVDPRTGQEAWRQTSYSGLNCSDVFDDDTIGCATAANGLVLLSARDGSEIAKLPGDYQAVQKLGDKYAYARHDDTTATVSLGTRTDPTAFWTHTEQIPGGTRTALTASDDVVVFTDGSATGGWSLAYTEQGQKIGGRTDQGSLIARDRYTAHPPGDSALMFDDTGKRLYFTSSTPTQPRLYAPAPGVDVAFTYDSAIDPTDGHVLWTLPWTPDSFGGDVVAVVGTVAVLNSSDQGRSVGIDIRSGRTLWEKPATSFSYDLATDGQRVFGTSDVGDRSLFAMDVATGDTSWSVALPDTGDYQKVVAVGDDIVVVGTQAIVGFHPTGGAAELFGGATPSSAQNASSPVTRCTKPPTVTPVTFSVDAQNLVVRLKFTPGCAKGDVLSNSMYQVTVRDQSSVVASSTFDLTTSPLAIPGGQDTLRDFAFPAGTYFRLPSSLAGGSGSSTSVGAGGERVECSGVGVDSVAPGQDFSESTGGSSAIVGAPQVAAQTGVDLSVNAVDALRAQANADRPLVQSQYLDRWLAQISAKQVRTPPMMATDVDDRTMVAWTPEQILRQHLDLRARYPEVRLLWSDEWRTFDLRGWWITVAQPNVLDAAGANAWCESKAIAPNQCFAKLVSNSRGSEGTTAYRPGTTG